MQIDTIFASSIFVKCALVQEKMGREENEITFSVMNAAKDVSMFACAALRSTAETQAATLMKEIAHLSAGVEKVGRLN